MLVSFSFAFAHLTVWLKSLLAYFTGKCIAASEKARAVLEG